eukprot:TRINITY_DN344_c0_g2_i2.p1 TRINITY_DN344_c0_g2~~TRINITY_DN344_c0_g2_i2.p1  ORF type:complete len:230 (+),score=51.81 TRINITY_DN344_c0_g2_i2:83-691(+)
MGEAEALQKRLEGVVSLFVSLSDDVQKRIDFIKEKEISQELLANKVKKDLEKISAQIDLNVGGLRVSASKETLLSIPGTYFYAMLSGDRWKPNDKGEYFIDRDPKFFNRIMTFLRTKEMDLSSLSEDDRTEFHRELDYFQIVPNKAKVKTDPPKWEWNFKSKSKNVYLDCFNSIAKSTGPNWNPIFWDQIDGILQDQNPRWQ